MLTQAVLASYIMSVAQLVAAHCEADRLKSLGKATAVYATLRDVPAELWKPRAPTTAIVITSMPKPSKAWADAWAKSILEAPLFAGNEKYEIIFGLTWAEKESNYKDEAVGDGGNSACSFQVSTFWGHSATELTKSPALCISMARSFMKKSYAIDPLHPMKMYAGGDNAAAMKLSDVRMKLVDQILLVAPSLPSSDV